MISNHQLEAILSLPDNSGGTAPVVEVSVDTESECLPTLECINDWSSAAMDGNAGGFALRIVGAEQMAELNRTYRKKPAATNVLSFPMEWPDELMDEIDSIGDIAICAQVVEHEAYEQHKSPAAHWAHMIVHGVLHLRGYDHQTQTQADEMESAEIRILDSLGFSNPYLSDNERIHDGKNSHE